MIQLKTINLQSLLTAVHINIPGIGIKRAHNLIKKVAESNGDVREVNIQ